MRTLRLLGFCALALLYRVFGFTGNGLHGVRRYRGTKISKETHPLFYRQLDEQDDEANLIKAKSRAPPGYDLKRQLSNEQLRIQKQPSRSTGMNVRLIIALFINQFLILGLATAAAAAFFFLGIGPNFMSELNQLLHWEGLVSSQAAASIFNLIPSPERIGKGVLGAIPMLAVASYIENSDRRIFHNINFSTISMCMTLFGRRKSPPDEFLPKMYQGRSFPTTSWSAALGVSAVLSAVTGLCEEGVFRRLIPGVAKRIIGPAIAPLMLIQATLFAFGHVKPQTVTRPENLVLLGLQLFNGLALGGIYLASGGDIVPCIIAHTVYDTVEFFKTWWDANQQLEYSETEYAKDLPPTIQAKVKALFRANGASFDSTRYRSLKRLFYTFDYNKNLTLSLSEVRKGLSYMAVERSGIPPPTEIIDRLFREVDVDSDGRLDFAEFVDLYFRSMTRKPPPALMAP